MKTPEKTVITIEATIQARVEKVWDLWTDPKHIIHWNNASDDWHTPKAENDLREGGRFLSRMEARDGSAGFDFTGIYSKVEKYQQIEYTMDDGRNVKISFAPMGNTTKLTEIFEAEQQNPVEVQRAGWQAILDNFKEYVESSAGKLTLHFEIAINAKAGKVYNTMLDDKTYREWTAAFNSSSHFTGSWEKGSKILFLGTDTDGSTEGMISRIKENIPHRFVSIEHLGVIQNGKEMLDGPETELWAGILENYTFKENNGSTLLTIDVGVTEEFRDYFEKTWPNALNVLKEICEK